MSDDWFTDPKSVLLQKFIPNLMAFNWTNQYKWAAVVYSAQGEGIDVQCGFTAYQCGSPLTSKSLSPLKESYTPRAQTSDGQRWLLSSCSVCQFLSLIYISFHLSRRCLILQTIHRHLICFWLQYEINIPPSHLSLSHQIENWRKLAQMY